MSANKNPSVPPIIYVVDRYCSLLDSTTPMVTDGFYLQYGTRMGLGPVDITRVKRLVQNFIRGGILRTKVDVSYVNGSIMSQCETLIQVLKDTLVDQLTRINSTSINGAVANYFVPIDQVYRDRMDKLLVDIDAGRFRYTDTLHERLMDLAYGLHSQFETYRSVMGTPCTNGDGVAIDAIIRFMAKTSDICAKAYSQKLDFKQVHLPLLKVMLNITRLTTGAIAEQNAPDEVVRLKKSLQYRISDALLASLPSPVPTEIETYEELEDQIISTRGLSYLKALTYYYTK